MLPRTALTVTYLFLITSGRSSSGTGIHSRPKDWLFPQKKNPDKPIDHQRIPSFILAHEKELGWEHRFTCHTFRHAFATYHYEDGTDLLTLKALMGHRSVSSTVIYVHLASNALMASSNPFDRMAGGLYE